MPPLSRPPSSPPELINSILAWGAKPPATHNLIGYILGLNISPLQLEISFLKEFSALFQTRTVRLYPLTDFKGNFKTSVFLTRSDKFRGDFAQKPVLNLLKVFTIATVI